MQEFIDILIKDSSNWARPRGIPCINKTVGDYHFILCLYNPNSRHSFITIKVRNISSLMRTVVLSRKIYNSNKDFETLKKIYTDAFAATAAR